MTLSNCVYTLEAPGTPCNLSMLFGIQGQAA